MQTELEKAVEFLSRDGPKTRDDTRELAKVLEENATVNLRLNNKNITDRGARALAEVLRKNNTLTTLDLDGTNITDRGVLELHPALKKNTTLTTLNLKGNNITDRGASYLAGALRNNTTLTTLNLEGNNITDEGASDLARALKKNTTLKCVVLNDNGVGDGLLKEIDELTNPNRKENTALTTLHFGRNELHNSTNERIQKSPEKDEPKKRTKVEKKVEPEKEATLLGVKMFESGKIEFQTNNQSKFSLQMSSFKEVDENENAIGTSASLKESKFDLHVDKDTELLKIFGDSKPSADDSGIAKGTHSYMETCMKSDSDHKYLIKVNAHHVTAPGKAGTKIENIDLVRGDFMVTVELSKDASGSQAARGYIDFKIEIQTSGSGIHEIPGLKFAYYLGEGTRMDLTNRYFESLNNGDKFEETSMPEGFPALDVDANDNRKCFISLRFHQYKGDGKIFYDPWFRSIYSRGGQFKVVDKVHPSCPVPVNFGEEWKVKVDHSIAAVIEAVGYTVDPKSIYSFLMDGKEIMSCNGGEVETHSYGHPSIKYLLKRLNYRENIKVWRDGAKFILAIFNEEKERKKSKEIIAESLRNAKKEEEKRKAEKEYRVVEGPIAPMKCKVMVSFNNSSAGEDAERLANYLTCNGYATFCTRLYCPNTLGNWRDFTVAGVATCKYYVMLLTNGWQKSKECQYETNIAMNCLAKGTLVPIPVWYDDFDDNFDQKDCFDIKNFKLAKRYRIRFEHIQSINRTSQNWMEGIKLLLEENE